MATLADIQVHLNAMQTTVPLIAAAIAAKDQQIADLQAQLDAMQPIIDALDAQAASILVDLEALVPVP